MEKKFKIRIALASITILFLAFIGYQLYLRYLGQDYGVMAEALIIGQFEFFGTFTLSSYNIFFDTLLLFGICVLSFAFEEMGLLDNYLDNPKDSYMEESQTIEEVEEQIDRLAGFLKKRLGFVSKIRNFTLPIWIATSVIGGCLMTLPSVFLIDERVRYVFETGELAGEEYLYVRYYGLVRGQLLLMGALLLAVGVILIFRSYKRRGRLRN